MVLMMASSYAQLNPVNNLNWHHWYEYPYNFYSLSWDVPALSVTDTLVGYNVYRDNDLWRFQESTGVFCIPDNCQDPYFLLIYGCWIKVKAVYNSNHAESLPGDSILDPGVLIGQKEISRLPAMILTNPVKRGEAIKLRVNGLPQELSITLLNTQGVKVKEVNTRGGKSAIELESAGLPAGLYFLVIQDDHSRGVQKVIIQ